MLKRHAVALTSAAMLAGLLSAALAGPASAAAPSNDDFAANTYLGSGATGSQAGTNVDATLETDEPQDATSGHVAKTVWYTWTAPANQQINFCVYGSGTLDDTTLGVYTGNVLASLTLVAADDDGGFGMGLFSQVRFSASSGTDYRIQVGGYEGAQGNFTLMWGPDCTAPETSVSIRVKGPNVVITVSGNDDVTAAGDLGFQCQIDSGGYEACTNGQSFGLPSGGHLIKVYAVDEAGNSDPFPAQRGFTIKSKKYG